VAVQEIMTNHLTNLN